MATAREELLNGWTAVPLDAGKLFNGKSYRNMPGPIKVADISFPNHEMVVAKVQAHAKETLSIETYNHSMRVYYYALTILKQQFPEEYITLSPATLALACLLHDIGTADEHQSATRMSFEFYGGIKALSILHELGSTKDQAEAISECIIRHQDLGTSGNITFLGQLIQLATIYDNVSNHPHMEHLATLIHNETREDVIQSFPRNGWLSCFARTIAKETELKPWSHTTHIPGFEKLVLSNSLMGQYE